MRKIQRFFFIVIIMLGSIAISLPIWTVWSVDAAGNLFGVGAPDHFMHMAFIGELKHHFPPQNPLFAGEPLYNYHYGSDLLVALVSSIFHIDQWLLYFRILPFVYSIVLGAAVWSVAKKLKLNRLEQWLSIFFMYFGSSFSFLAAFMMRKPLSWNDAFGISQPAEMTGNMPYLCSLALFFVILSLLLSWLSAPCKKLFFLIISLSIFLSIVKVYAGILLLCIFIWLLAISIVRKRAFALKLFAMVVFTTAGTGALLLSISHNTGGLVWYPLHPLKRMIEGPNFFEYTNDIVLRIWHYESKGNMLRLAEIFGIAAIIYIVGNLGTRAIGMFLAMFKLIQKRKISDMSLALVGGGLTISVIALLFMQETGGFNITQLYLYVLALVSIPAAIGWGALLARKSIFLRAVVWIVLFALTLPSPVWSIKEHLMSAAQKVQASDARALREMSKIINKNSVIILSPDLVQDSANNISAIAERRVYLEGLEYAHIQGHDIEKRQDTLLLLFKSINRYTSISNIEQELDIAPISALVVGKKYSLSLEDMQLWKQSETYDIYLPK